MKKPKIKVYFFAGGLIKLYFTKKAKTIPAGFRLCDLQSKNKKHRGLMRITPIRLTNCYPDTEK